jgi:hypothetical protein
VLGSAALVVFVLDARGVAAFGAAALRGARRRGVAGFDAAGVGVSLESSAMICSRIDDFGSATHGRRGVSESVSETAAR